ncbi:MAG: OsmC family protein [Chloroflexota bacterium]
MAEYMMTVQWDRQEATFTDRTYSRAHVWRFDGGAEIPASSSPQVVPLPYSVAANVDPEEAFVAALASCHMLWFLDLAARRGFIVDTYTDGATGVMGKNDANQLVMTHVTLHPHTVFSGPRHPSEEDVRTLHHLAHRQCFLANSVKTAVETSPTWDLVGEGPAATP